MPRSKAKTDGVDREDVSRSLYEIGTKVLELEQIEAEMQAEIDAVKASYAHRLETRRETIERLQRDLRLACEDSRQDLLPADRKSVDTLFGQVGWRSQPDRIVLQEGVNSQTAGEALRAHGFPGAVRVRLAPDKPAIKTALNNGQITTRHLKACGLALRPGSEDWWCEIDRESVREHLEE